jgi:TusA-related sulfurtransferase
VIGKVNAPYKNNREVLMQFLSGDFKDKLHNGDTIKIIGDSPFHSKDFVSMVTNKNIKVALNENDDYIYQIQYEASKNTAVVNIYDNNSKKNFLITYEKIGNTWKEQYNEYKGGLKNAGSILPIFNNFYNWEGKVGGFRWAKPGSNILWINSSNVIKPQKLLFRIKSLNARNIIINLNKSEVYSLSLRPNIAYVVNKNISLQPGRNTIEFITEEPPIDPPGPDNRALMFSIEKVHPFYQEDK